MIEVGHKKISYSELIDFIKKRKEEVGKTNSELAVCAGLKDTQTIANSLNKKKQTVKDKVLTKLMCCLNINGIVVWESGERFYYIK